jgi:hypothetical protein
MPGRPTLRVLGRDKPANAVVARAALWFVVAIWIIVVVLLTSAVPRE